MTIIRSGSDEDANVFLLFVKITLKTKLSYPEFVLFYVKLKGSHSSYSNVFLLLWVRITLKTEIPLPEFVLSNVKFKRGVFIFLPTLPLFTTD